MSRSQTARGVSRVSDSWLAGGAFAIVCFSVLFATAESIGVTWDEPVYSQAAEQAAHWLGLVLRGDLKAAWDPHAFGIGWGLVNEHPPLVRVISAVGWAATRDLLPPPLAHRAGTMVLAALALGVIVGVIARWRGAWAGLFAGAAVLAMPRVFYHAHLVALDFPLAAVWMLATLAFYRVAQRLRWWSPLAMGLGLGLALLTKINAILLVPFWAIWLLVYRRTWRWLAAFAACLPVAAAVLVAGWPWIWKDPVGGLWNWVQFFRVHYEIRQWYAGQLFVQTPWYLPWVMVGIATPVALLLLAMVGAGGLGSLQVADDEMEGAGSNSRSGVLPLSFALSEWNGLHLLGLLTVLGYYTLPVTAIHDQERLLLPALLHLAVLAGEGFAWLAVRARGWVASRWPQTGAGAAGLRGHALSAALGLLLLLPGLLGIMTLHPYELSYYNELVGGVRGARRLDLETIYFASTYGHFLPDLNRLPSGSKLWVMPNSYDVIYYYQLNGLLRDDIIVLRPAGWSSFYDDQGVPSAVGGLEAADFALIEHRQTTFNDAIPEYAVQLEWAATKPQIAALYREGVLLAALYAR